jgi:hypothetical protein
MIEYLTIAIGATIAVGSVALELAPNIQTGPAWIKASLMCIMVLGCFIVSLA